MPFQIAGPSGNVAEVTPSNELKTALTIVQEEAGYAVALGERDDGSITGTPDRSPFEVSADYRMRAGIDTLAASWQFVGAALDTTVWTAPVTTMTVTVSTGFVTLNAGSSIAANAVARLSSWRAFPAWGSFTTWLEMNVQIAELPTANNTCEWGFAIASGVAAPTDGCFFRINALGEFRAVLNYNGTESQSAILDFAALVGQNTTRAFLIGVHNTSVTFWIDDTLVASFNLGASAASMNSAMELPVMFRCYNGIVAPTTPQQMKIGACNVSLGEYHGTKRHDHIMAGFGGGSYQGQTGGTLGSTSNITNATATPPPAAVAATNTTAALGSGLGGLYYELPTIAANTDGIIDSYQVPVIATNATNKTLYITGVTIDSFIQTTLTGGGCVSVFTLCFGHTSVSLATAESATSKAPRRVFLGNQPMAAAAAAGTLLTKITQMFDTPIVVQPGEFVQVVRRTIGTAPTAGSVGHGIVFDGYWE